MESNNAETRKKSEPQGFRGRLANFIELARTIIYAVLIAVGIRTLAYEPFSIPSGSMIPTLLIGDYLFVSKFSYGYSRHSLPFSLSIFDGRVFGSAPERGDVAVFKYPVRDRNFEKDYIKRIVGLPGDRVKVASGVLHINGTPVRRMKRFASIGCCSQSGAHASNTRLPLRLTRIPGTGLVAHVPRTRSLRTWG